MAADRAERRAAHWARTRAVTFVVLIIWFVFSFVLPWFARELNEFEFLGFRLGYYIVVQGSLAVFVLLIVIQNFIQDGIDRAYGSGE